MPTLKKILVVDDDRDIIELLAYNLKNRGFDVTSTISPTQAIWKLENESHPDLIVLDRMIPFLSGDELCRFVKEKDDLRQIPVVIISAKGDYRDISEGMALGAAVYLPKPFSMDLFLKTVQDLTPLSNLAAPETNDSLHSAKG